MNRMVRVTEIPTSSGAPSAWDNEDVYDEIPEGDDTAYEAYKSLSKAALGSILITSLGLLGLISPPFLAFAGLGLLLGIWAVRNLRRYPDVLSGWIVATVGLVGAGVLLVGGSAMHAYVYMTEVPDGYTRISFADLQPTTTDPQTGEPAIPTELDGQRVFVKGYVHPGVSNLGYNKKFILVPDMGTCCFGGQPELTDMIEVTIVEQRGVKYSARKRKLGGTFRVTNRVKKVAGGLDGGLYELQADYVN